MYVSLFLLISVGIPMYFPVELKAAPPDMPRFPLAFVM